ncbi:Prefoldin subunit alpha [subsurface metagenome]
MKNKGQEKQKEQQTQQELFYKLSMFDQHIKQINQQLQLIEKNIFDLNSLDSGMDEIKGSVGKEILGQLGRGIFVKANIISEELVVDVGNKNFVKKSITDTKKIIKEQIEKLRQIEKELKDKIEEINEEVAGLVLEVQKKSI